MPKSRSALVASSNENAIWIGYACEMNNVSEPSGVLDTVVSAGGFFLRHQRAFWRPVSLLAPAVGVVSMAVGAAIGNTAPGSTAPTLPVLFFQIYFAYYWLRRALSVPGKPVLRQVEEEDRVGPPSHMVFIRYAVLLALSFALTIGPVGVVMLRILAGLAGTRYAFLGGMLAPEQFFFNAIVLGPVYLLLSCRFLLVFPARAIGIEMSLGQAWSATRGATWRLFGTQMLCAIIGLALFGFSLTVPWSFLLFFPNYGVLALAAVSIAVAVASAIYIALATHCLGQLYRQYETRLIERYGP